MIPKRPEVPPLTDQHIRELTKIVFLEEETQFIEREYDLIFVFGGTHPGCWQTAYKAYDRKLADKLLLTGGWKPNGIRHPEWTYGETSESRVMEQKLLALGVPKTSMIIEDQSEDTLENVIFAKKIFDFTTIQSLVFICKSYATGRQYRTLKKHLPEHIQFTAFPFHAALPSNQMVTRDNWMDAKESRSYVYGEYLRIITYGKQGDIIPLDETIQGLEG